MNSGRPLRAVIDTNVLLDFWVFDDPAARTLRSAIEERRVRVLRSGLLVDELVDVLMRPAFDISTDRRFEILRDWDKFAESVERIDAAPLECSDRSDQKFLDLAFSSGADWLVTKDKALLKLARQAERHGLTILMPGDAGQRIALTEHS
jgi:putative PIN family toxin of toxin-antitoxin system